MRAARLIWSLLGYDAGWIACVLAASSGRWWLSLPAVLFIVVIHIAMAPRPKREVLSILVVTAIGACADSALAAMSLISLNAHPGLSLPFVLWIAALWANFAPLLTTLLAWFRRHLVLAALLGAASAPVAYFGASKFGAIEITQPESVVYGAVALEYAILLPLSLVISARITAPQERPREASGTSHTEPTSTGTS
ncbi:MAG: DUF2878 domain-containing protein [Phycisphaeraceae bacterium]|nr:DUF2878 domain-containing protein [Phycisphaerales bacterium]MCB9843602.1 DUF2878 domain-containing protein [Phycisphaeraceae bacterium]